MERLRLTVDRRMKAVGQIEGLRRARLHCVGWVFYFSLRVRVPCRWFVS
jgi:hypothetical protein